MQFVPSTVPKQLPRGYPVPLMTSTPLLPLQELEEIMEERRAVRKTLDTDGGRKTGNVLCEVDINSRLPENPRELKLSTVGNKLSKKGKVISSREQFVAGGKENNGVSIDSTDRKKQVMLVKREGVHQMARLLWGRRRGEKKGIQERKGEMEGNHGGGGTEGSKGDGQARVKRRGDFVVGEAAAGKVRSSRRRDTGNGGHSGDALQPKRTEDIQVEEGVALGEGTLVSDCMDREGEGEGGMHLCLTLFQLLSGSGGEE